MNDKQWLIERDKALYALRMEAVSRAQAVFDEWKRVVKGVGDE